MKAAVLLAGLVMVGSAAGANCSRNDLQCRARLGIGAADRNCPDYIERHSEYSVRWTDEMGKPRFSRFNWTAEEGGGITYMGDRVEFQNAFGAYQPMRYLCEMSADGKTVVEARVYKGRLPIK